MFKRCDLNRLVSKMNQKFSLVSTVFNEAGRLDKTIGDLEAQTIKPDEIIITDAGSNDGTYQKLLEWSEHSRLAIRILLKPKCNVAQGRNLAIRDAKNNIIVSTDFGCRFHPRWLESIVAPFEDGSVKVVGGAYTVDEENLTTLAARGNYILTNGYQVALDDSFIPSSRSIAYYKSVWQEIGGYCEWLTLAADDLVFGKAIKAKGFKTVLINDPFVFWGRHEKLKSYGKEAFRYGLGDGEARVNKRNTFSIVVELILRYCLFASVGIFVINQLLAIIPSYYFFITVLFLPGLRSYYWSFRNWRNLRSSKYNLAAFLFSIVLIEATRFNYLKGYAKGFWFSPNSVKIKALELQQSVR
jgi:glycosyltransferase involved in cell wall biosynthesis